MSKCPICHKITWFGFVIISMPHTQHISHSFELIALCRMQNLNYEKNRLIHRPTKNIPYPHPSVHAMKKKFLKTSYTLADISKVYHTGRKTSYPTNSWVIFFICFVFVLCYTLAMPWSTFGFTLRNYLGCTKGTIWDTEIRPRSALYKVKSPYYLLYYCFRALLEFLSSANF